MLHFGLLGGKLGHSYSPAIHSLLADYEYLLYECTPEDLDAFMKNGTWDGINVTIPYKKDVMPYCKTLSETAKRIGSVNTITRNPDGSLRGDNTDAFGFESMVRAAGITVAGKKAIVLGSGGSAVTVCAVLESMGAGSITVISRSGPDNYTNLHRHSDAQIIVNTTPVGMFPKNGAAPVDLMQFPACEGVLDIVYNPARTALILQAEQLGIRCKSGLHMLVAQAARGCELFTGKKSTMEDIARIEHTINDTLQNIVLIGMPGCGKSTVAVKLGQRLNRPVYEADAILAEKAGMPIPEIFAQYGEDHFRTLETEVLRELSKLSGAIISTGGGCVTRGENYPLLHQNSRIIWLRRDIQKLDKTGRPVSQKNDLSELYAKRREHYTRFADAAVDNNGELDATVDAVVQELRGI